MTTSKMLRSGTFSRKTIKALRASLAPVPADDVHTGKPIVRTSPDGKRVTVLCPYGHLVTAIPMKEWAGSALEARLGRPDYVVNCRGAL